MNELLTQEISRLIAENKEAFIISEMQPYIERNSNGKLQFVTPLKIEMQNLKDYKEKVRRILQELHDDEDSEFGTSAYVWLKQELDLK